MVVVLFGIMDTPTIPGMPQPGPQERLGVILPDSMKAVGGVEAGSAAAEVAPMPGAAEAAPGAGAPAAPASAHLTAADVAAAIAAVPNPAPVTPGSNTSQGPAPATAADVDLIEPEWVSKAEQVVARHRGDPYAEEEAVEELQQDYLQKRYGIGVAKPDQHGSPKAGQ